MAGRILDEIVFPTLRGMAAEGRPYRGFLYCGLMLTADGPKVIEFNARMGDPETQVVLPALDEDLLPHLRAAARRRARVRRRSARAPTAYVGVVAGVGRLPGQVRDRARSIAGLDDAAALPGALVFHAGTAARDGGIVTAGGRVLTVVGRGADFAAARAARLRGGRRISFDGMHYRRDIGVRAIGSQ